MTTPYTTGTITLTNGSAVVTGIGTAWQIALIKGGIVYPEAAGNGLPIATVDSDTQITAAVEWTGETGTYSYALVRDTAYDAQIAQNAEALARLLAGLEAGTIWKYDMSGDAAGRDIYDGKPKGFSYLDVSVVPAQLWVKASNTEGDWAGPFNYGQGPAGPPGTPGEDGEDGAPGPYTDISVGGVTTLPSGSSATVTATPTGPGAIELEFGIPAGADGEGTGDVVGPAGATSGRMALFDGGTGKLLMEGPLPFSGAYADLSGKPKGFSYLDVSVVPAQLWVKASNTEGDWAGPHSYGQGAEGEAGPPGPAANVVFEEPETGLPGTDVEMDVTGSGTTGDPYHVTFTIPRGDPGQDGTGTGDVTGPAGVSAGRIALFDGITGKLLMEGPLPFSGAYADLSGKPTLGGAAALSVGTAAGTVAAGDDSRIVNAVSREGDTALKGYSATSKNLGTLSGAVTLTYDTGNIQHGTNGGAVTISAPTATGVYTIIVEIVNGASAGAVTLSGFTKVDGDAFTTTNGHKFHLHVAKTNIAVSATVKALQ